MKYAVSLIVPDAYKDTADRVAVALGYTQVGDSTYAAPLSADGAEPPSHWHCHTSATQDFANLMEAAGNGVGLPPVNWSLVGTTEAAVYAMAAALLVRVRGLDEYSSNGSDHKIESGLQVIQPPFTA